MGQSLNPGLLIENSLRILPKLHESREQTETTVSDIEEATNVRFEAVNSPNNDFLEKLGLDFCSNCDK